MSFLLVDRVSYPIAVSIDWRSIDIYLGLVIVQVISICWCRFHLSIEIRMCRVDWLKLYWYPSIWVLLESVFASFYESKRKVEAVRAIYWQIFVSAKVNISKLFLAIEETKFRLRSSLIFSLSFSMKAKASVSSFYYYYWISPFNRLDLVLFWLLWWIIICINSVFFHFSQ